MRSLTASGASVLDVPFDLVQEACRSASEVASRAPATSLPQAAATELADAKASSPESDLMPDASGEESMAGGDGRNDDGGGMSDPQLGSPGGDATGAAIDDGIGGNPDIYVGFERNAAVVDHSPTDGGAVKQDEGFCPASSLGTTIKETAGGQGADAVSLATSNITDCEARLDDPDATPPPRAKDSGSEAGIVDDAKRARSAQANGRYDSVLESSLLSPESATAGVEPQLPSGSSDAVVAELALSTTDTEQEDVAALKTTDDPSNEGGGEAVEGRRSFMSISTKSSEGPASANSADGDAAASGNSQDESLSHLPAPGFESHENAEEPADPERLVADLQQATPGMETSVVVEESKLVSPLTSTTIDREVGLPAGGTTNDNDNTFDLHDEAAPASAPTSPQENEDDVDYELDSDFGNDSGDETLPPAATGTSSGAGASPSTRIDPVETKSTEAGDGNRGEAFPLEEVAIAPEVGHANVDDDSDYPPDIDSVVDDNHSSSNNSSSSGESSLGASDGGNSGSVTGGEEDSSHSKSARGSSSSSGSSSRSGSSGNLSISDSDDGYPDSDDPTASSPSPPGDVTVESPAREVENTGDNDDDDDDDDDDDYSLGSSAGSAKGSSSEQSPIAANSAHQSVAKNEPSLLSREAEPHTLRDVVLAAETATTAAPGLIEADTEPTTGAEITATENKNQFEAPVVADGGGAGEGLPNVAIDEHRHGCSNRNSSGTVSEQITPTEPELVEPETTKTEDVYKPNLDNIDTSVDVGELKNRFSLMLTSSFDPAADSSGADEPYTAASETSLAPPEDPANEGLGGQSRSPAGEQMGATGGNTLAEVGSRSYRTYNTFDLMPRRRFLLQEASTWCGDALLKEVGGRKGSGLQGTGEPSSRACANPYCVLSSRKSLFS